MIIRDVFFKCSDVLKNIISPPHCSSCKKFLHERSVFCFECEKKLKPIVSHTLDITPSKSIKVFSVSRYVDPFSVFGLDLWLKGMCENFGLHFLSPVSY